MTASVRAFQPAARFTVGAITPKGAITVFSTRAAVVADAIIRPIARVPAVRGVSSDIAELGAARGLLTRGLDEWTSQSRAGMRGKE